jgi:uncharacterized RDD family membrane protein YckC
MPFCPECSEEYRFGSDRCEMCNTILIQPNPCEARAHSELPVAPRWPRVAAGIIDLSIAYGLALVVLTFWRKLLLWRFASAGVFLVLPLLYLLLKDAVGGKSVGKIVLGILVFDEKAGRIAGVADSIIRNWALAIPVFGPTVVACIMGAEILAGRRRRLGEYKAGTIVVTDLTYLRNR